MKFAPAPGSDFSKRYNNGQVIEQRNFRRNIIRLVAVTLSIVVGDSESIMHWYSMNNGFVM